MKVLVVIPTFNDKSTIIDVVQDVEKHAPMVDVLVIDRCSTDGTMEVLPRFNVQHFILPIKGDYKSALNLGMEYALAEQYDAVIEYDSKNRFNAEDIPYMVRTMEQQDVDIVLGSRYLIDKMPVNRKFIGQWLLRFLTKSISGATITDPYFRFRMLSRDIMNEFQNSHYWTIDNDTIIHLIKMKYKCMEITTRSNSEFRRWKGFSSIWNLAWLMSSIIFVQPFRLRGH